MIDWLSFAMGGLCVFTFVVGVLAVVNAVQITRKRRCCGCGGCR